MPPRNRKRKTAPADEEEPPVSRPQRSSRSNAQVSSPLTTSGPRTAAPAGRGGRKPAASKAKGKQPVVEPVEPEQIDIEVDPAIPVTYDNFRDSWIQSLHEGNPSTLELGRRFGSKLMTQWLDVAEDSPDITYCDGANDGGIDIAYLQRNDADEEREEAGDTWYILQAKYGTSFRGKDTIYREGMKVLDTLTGKHGKLSQATASVVERIAIFRNQADPDNDKLVLVFGLEKPLTEQEQEARDEIRRIGRQRLGDIFHIMEVSIETIWRQAVQADEHNPAPRVVLLKVDQKHLLGDFSDPTNLPVKVIGDIPLLNVYEFLDRYQKATGDLDELFEKNVRRFLGTRGRVNKGMKETLTTEPHRFSLFNNGARIVCDTYKVLPDGLELRNPYVVNGCQTTRTIWEVCEPKFNAGGSRAGPAIEDFKRQLRGGSLLMTIISTGNTNDGHDLQFKITKFTNSQTAVRGKDFLALSQEGSVWSKGLANFGIYLERQRGAADAQQAKQKRSPTTFQFEKFTNLFDLVKVYSSGWLNQVGLSYGPHRHFTIGGWVFEQLTQGANPLTVNDLLAAFKLQEAATGHFGRTVDKASRRQSKFLFYYVTCDFVREVLKWNKRDLNLDNVANGHVSKAIVAIFDGSHPRAAKVLVDNALSFIDNYLNEESQHSYTKEPLFESLNRNLSRLLKSPQLGTDADGKMPELQKLRSLYHTLLGGTFMGSPTSAATLIVAAIQGVPEAPMGES